MLDMLEAFNDGQEFSISDRIVPFSLIQRLRVVGYGAAFVVVISLVQYAS
jgi:hypothetical protein